STAWRSIGHARAFPITVQNLGRSQTNERLLEKENMTTQTAKAQTAISAAGKAAIQGLVRGLAVDLASRAITVNNVRPGPIATEINPASGPEAESLQKMILLG